MDNVSKVDKHQQYLDEHDRLANLFITDRFAFELERKRLIQETIESTYSNHYKLWDQQKELDSILKGAGSPENRFAMIQALFWYHMVNNWQPQLLENTTELRGVMGATPNRPRLSLVK